MTKPNVTDHRVQVNFPENLYQLVREEAFKRNVSISGFIRDTIKIAFKIEDKAETQKAKAWDRFMDRYVGIIKGKPDDSKTHDKWAHKTATFHAE